MKAAGISTMKNQAWSFAMPGADQHDTSVAVPPVRVVPPPQSRRNPAGSTVELQSSHWGLAHPRPESDPVTEDPEKVTQYAGTGKDANAPAGIRTMGSGQWNFSMPGADQ